MAIETKIYTLLTGASTITNIVSTRIYVSTFPDLVTYPSLLFTRTGTEPMNTLDGALLNAERVDIQIDNFTTSYKTAFELSTVVERVMHDSGTFKSKLIINQDLSQTLPDMKRLYRISQEYSCWDQ